METFSTSNSFANSIQRSEIKVFFDSDFKTFEKATNGSGEVKQAVVEKEESTPVKEESTGIVDDEIPF